MTNLQIVFICLFALLVISQLILLYNSKYREQQANRASSDRDELLTFINRYTASIGYVHNTREWMSQVAQFVAQAIEASTVFLIFIENDNEARIVASYGKIPDHEGNISSQSQKLIDDLQAGTIVYNTTGLISEVIGPVSILKQDFHKQYGDGPIDSLVSVPMRIDTEQIGMICAINRNAKIPFNQQSLFLLESLSSQVAFGLTFVEMYERLGKQQRIEQELELAKNIQLSLLPSKAPRHHNYRIYADCIAAREVSGDFFDFIQISDDLLLVVVADASGKGIPACMLMAMCRSILRTNAGRFKEDLEGLMHESG